KVVAADAAHDAGGDGIREQAKRGADGKDLLTGRELGGVAEGDDRWHSIGIDLDDGKVVPGILADEFGFDLRSIGEDDHERVAALDHVPVGDNVALLADDEAGSRALNDGLTLAGLAEEVGLGRDVPHGNNGWTDLLDHLDL